MKSKKTILIIVLLALCLAATVACKPVGGGTLASPTITLEDNVVSWQAVENATGYSVKVGSDAAVSVTTTSYTVNKTAAGSYKITVTAVSSDDKWKESAPSNEVTYVVEDGGSEKTALAAPVITLNGNTVSWTAVPNAVSYDVKVNGANPINVTVTSYALTQTAVGNYKVTVTAKAGNSETYKDSVASNEVTYVIDQEIEVTLTEIDVDPVGVPTTVYLDQGITELDLSQIVITAYYSNNTDKRLALSDVVIGEYDLTTIGRKSITVTYTENGVTADPFVIRVDVKERGVDEIDEFDALLLEYSDAGKYTIEGAAAIRNMKGENMLEDGQVTLPQGKTLLSIDGKFVVVTVAKLVSDKNSFLAIADDMDGYYVLTKDIDFESKWHAGAYIGAAPLDGRNYLDYENGIGVATTGEGREAKGQLGVAFNGTLDGQGYALRNIKLSCNEFTNSNLGRGLAIFGYLGEDGVIENVNLRNVLLNGGKFNSFLVGYNKGTINNICVEADCSMTSAFNGGCLVAGYNDGNVSNVVSYVSQYMGWSNKINDFVAANNNDIADDATGVLKGSSSNIYIADKSDLTATLGSGWKYFDGFGTVLANDDYVLISTSEHELAVGTKLYLNALFVDGDKVNFALYNPDAIDPDTGVVKYGWDGEKGSHYLYVNLNADPMITVGSEVKVVIYSTGWKTSQEILITIVAPVVVDNELVNPSIDKIEGTDLKTSDVQIKQIYSDGSENIISAIKLEGFDKNGTVGAVQTVKAFYGEGEDDYVEIAVTLIAKSVESIAIDTASSYKKVYNVGDELDLAGLKITVTYNNGTNESIAVTSGMLSEYDLSTAGSKQITITHGGKTCVLNVTVNEAGVEVTSISVVGTPAKTTYKLNEEVTIENLAGATVTATNSNGTTTEDIAITLAMVSYNFNTVGQSAITVTYEGKTAAIAVTVADYATALNVTANETVLTYSRKSAALDLVANATYTLTMASGATQHVTTGVTASEYKPGLNTITYTYTDEYATVTATQQYEIWYEVYNFEGAGDPNTVDLADWAFMQSHLDGYFRLVEDLDFSGKNMTPLGKRPIQGGDDTTCNVDDPFADGLVVKAEPFVGKFDGNGHIVKWIAVEGSGFNDAGFGLSIFGYIGATGEVKNFILKNTSVKSKNQTGFIATVNEGLIENVQIDATCSITANWLTAGVVVYNKGNGIIRNVVCYVDVAVKEDKVSTGALKAVYTNYATAENCYAVSDTDEETGTKTFLEASKALDGVDGWIYREGVGPTREPFADVTLVNAEVAVDGIINFTIKLGNATIGTFAIIRPVSGADNDVYYDITANEDGSYTLDLSSKAILAERVCVGDKVTLLVSTMGAGYATAEITITAKEGA